MISNRILNALIFNNKNHQLQMFKNTFNKHRLLFKYSLNMFLKNIITAI